MHHDGSVFDSPEIGAAPVLQRLAVKHLNPAGMVVEVDRIRRDIAWRRWSASCLSTPPLTAARSRGLSPSSRSARCLRPGWRRGGRRDDARDENKLKCSHRYSKRKATSASEIGRPLPMLVPPDAAITTYCLPSLPM